MSYQLSIKKIAQSSLDSAPLQELIIALNEQHEELVSGGAKEKFERTKPHVNIGTISSANPYEGCDPGTCC